MKVCRKILPLILLASIPAVVGCWFMVSPKQEMYRLFLVATLLYPLSLLVLIPVWKNSKQSYENISQQQELIENITGRLERLENHIKGQCINDPLLLPKLTTRSGENSFHYTFRQKYPGFIPRLRTLVPDITPGEEHLCMMIKLNMSTWEIAQMLAIDVKSVHTARARLKRKLRLNREAKINDWINNINIQQ